MMCYCISTIGLVFWRGKFSEFGAVRHCSCLHFLSFPHVFRYCVCRSHDPSRNVIRAEVWQRPSRAWNLESRSEGPSSCICRLFAAGTWSLYWIDTEMPTVAGLFWTPPYVVKLALTFGALSRYNLIWITFMMLNNTRPTQIRTNDFISNIVML